MEGAEQGETRSGEKERRAHWRLEERGEGGRGRVARRVAHESDGVGRREQCSGAARVLGERHGGMLGRRAWRRGHRSDPARVGSSCRE